MFASVCLQLPGYHYSDGRYYVRLSEEHYRISGEMPDDFGYIIHCGVRVLKWQRWGIKDLEVIGKTYHWRNK